MSSKNAVIPGCGYHHVAIRAADFEGAVRFYTEGLGFRLAVRWGEGDGRAALLDGGDGNYMEVFAGGKRLLALVIAPLRDVIVLDAIDVRALPVAGAGQFLDVGDVHWRELRRQLDDDALAGRKVDHQQVVGRDLRPFCGLGSGNRVGRGLGRRWRFGRRRGGDKR